MSSVTTHGLVYIYFTFDCRLVVSRALIYNLTTKVTPLDQVYCYCLINTHTFLCGKSWQGFNGSPWLVSPRLAPHLLRIISIGSLQADGAARGPKLPSRWRKRVPTQCQQPRSQTPCIRSYMTCTRSAITRYQLTEEREDCRVKSDCNQEADLSESWIEDKDPVESMISLRV